MPRRRQALPLAHAIYHSERLRHNQNKLEWGMRTLIVSWLPKEFTPPFLTDAGFGREEFIRWLKHHGLAFVFHLRPDTIVNYCELQCPMGDFDTPEGIPLSC